MQLTKQQIMDNIDFVSDIHIDSWKHNLGKQFNIKTFIEDILSPNNYTLIIAGDISNHNEDIFMLLTELKEYYHNIIIVPGNHEMYLIDSDQDKYQRESENRLQELKDFCNSNGIYYLDGQVIDIDGIKIGGTGMFHDYSYGKFFKKKREQIIELWYRTLNDWQYIFSGGEDNYQIPMAYSGYVNISNFDPIKKFKSELKKLDQIQECDILVTHYPPIMPEKSKYKQVSSSIFYLFDGKKYLKKIKPKYWIFAHMHQQFEQKMESTILCSNPLGYYDENPFSRIKKIGDIN